MRLVLGVLDVSYAEANGDGTTSTGDVAELLEKNYGVMRTFYELNEEQISAMLAESVADSINAVVNGAPPAASVSYAGEQKIEAAFRTFIYGNEMQKIMDRVGGVVSQAAQKGVTKRKKTRGAPRPAFVDTGLYVESFRAWIDKK